METNIGLTSKIKELNTAWEVRERELIERHFQDNIVTLQRVIAWRDAANKDLIARGALYRLMADVGAKEDSKEERVIKMTNACITWMQTFGYVSSPKTSDMKVMPMILFPFQKRLIEEMIRSIEFGTDFLIEKSREMGVSWVAIYVFVWYWLFVPESNFLIGSYKEKLVIENSPDSIIGKAKYIIKDQPKWILPRGFNPKLHMLADKLINPMINSYITGDTMNPNFGRGARKTAIFFDELGFWDYAKAAWESCGETTKCRIGNSTPSGYNYYKYLIDSGLNKITLHWREHPLKDDLWYEYKKATNTTDAVAREIDISYDASKTGVIYHEWRTNRVYGDFNYDSNYPLYVGWDFGNKDGTAIIWVQVVDGKVRVIDSYYKTGINLIDFFAPIVTGNILTEYQYNYTEEEMDMIQEHKKWKQAVHFGDPAGRNVSQGMDKSVIDTLSKYGIKINYDNKKIDHPSRHSDTKKVIMRGIEFNKTERNKWLDMSLMNYSFKATNVEGIQQVKRNATVNHDQYSHSATAFEYLCVGLSSLKHENKTMVRDKPSMCGYYSSKKRKTFY